MSAHKGRIHWSFVPAAAFFVALLWIRQGVVGVVAGLLIAVALVAVAEWRAARRRGREP